MGFSENISSIREELSLGCEEEGIKIWLFLTTILFIIQYWRKVVEGVTECTLD